MESGLIAFTGLHALCECAPRHLLKFTARGEIIAFVGECMYEERTSESMREQERA